MEKLREQGDLIDEEDHANNVGFSERADVPIEPRLSEQWFLAPPQSGRGKAGSFRGNDPIFPREVDQDLPPLVGQHSGLVHKPATLVGSPYTCMVPQRRNRKDPQNWHVSVDGPTGPENWEQDDVLDTWASSWLWPIATMGWPNDSAMKEQGLTIFTPHLHW